MNPFALLALSLASACRITSIASIDQVPKDKLAIIAGMELNRETQITLNGEGISSYMESGNTLLWNKKQFSFVTIRSSESSTWVVMQDFVNSHECRVIWFVNRYEKRDAEMIKREFPACPITKVQGSEVSNFTSNPAQKEKAKLSEVHDDIVKREMAPKPRANRKNY